MEHELEIKIAWENGVGFLVTAKADTGPIVKVLEAEENGKISDLWKHYQEAIEKFVKVNLEHIGQEMMQ